MPSPFARSLSNDRYNKWFPLIVIILVVSILGLMYYYTTAADKPQQFVARPITKKKDEVKALIVASTGFISMEGVHEFDHKEMFYSTAGLETLPIFLLIHNDENGASGKDWGHMYECFANQGTYFAPDLINHGKSEPGPTTMKRVIPEEEHADSLSIFIERMFPDRHDIILVAKGEGAQMAFEIARQERPHIAGLLLFAPTFNKPVYDIEDIPVLLIWTKEDTVVPFSGAQDIENAFFDVQTLYFDSILPEGVAKAESHHPEKFKLEQIDLKVQDWVTYIRTYRVPEKQEEQQLL